MRGISSRQKLNCDTPQPSCCDYTSFLRKRNGALLTNPSRIRRSRYRCNGHQGRYAFAAFYVSTISVARIFLFCCIIHRTIQHSNSLIRNTQMPHVSSALSMTTTRSRALPRPLSILSVASNTISKETHVAEPASPTRSLASSVRTHYKRDFRTYDDQERIHLDWMVRNTAKILGVDAARTLRFVIAF